jgi:peptidylprolyl isomerase
MLCLDHGVPAGQFAVSQSLKEGSPMRARLLWLLLTVVLLATSAACGPSEEEQKATATAMAAEAFATQTANAPTATNTPTPTPLPTDTPTATPTNTPSPTATPVPTNSPTPSPTPTPDYSDIGLTLADMPEGFVPDPDVAEIFVVGQEGVFSVPSTIANSFGFGDEEEKNIVVGFSVSLDAADIPAFDEQIDFLNQLVVADAEVPEGVESELPAEPDNIGDIIASDLAIVTDDVGDTYVTDVLTFRRGNVVTFLGVLQLATGERPLDIAELARLIDQRIMASSEAAGSGQSAAVPENDFDLYAGLGEDAFETTDSGLRYAILEEGGAGQQVEAGQLVSVHYTGYFEDGRSFDNSIARGEPFTFQLGQEMVIAGWEEGIALLEVGDKARLIIPSELAYGETGNQAIPANATLIFDVEVLAVSDGPPEAPLAVDAADYVVTDSGLKYYDIVFGDGDSPAEGQLAIMDFTIWLDDGTMLGSTVALGQPAPATIGSGQLLPGWEEGLLSMKVGGSRQLVIPPELAFGAAGSPDGAIPPNATLIVEMELLAVEDGG